MTRELGVLVKALLAREDRVSEAVLARINREHPPRDGTPAIGLQGVSLRVSAERRRTGAYSRVWHRMIGG